MPDDRPARSSAGSYWYAAEGDDAVCAVDVLQALRRFHAADSGMRRRVRAAMDMNETDLLALRHLISCESGGEQVSPKGLSVFLGISSAATAKLLARLAGSGHIRREPHPRDRRSQVIHATPRAHRDVRRTLEAMHAHMFQVAEALTPEQQKAVIHFLGALTVAIAMPDRETGA